MPRLVRGASADEIPAGGGKAVEVDGVLLAVCSRGDWLLVGGALAALWLEPRRTTEDVDLVGLGGTIEERLSLMRLAGELGLPVEAVNSAADSFVRRIEGWRDELELFRTGGKGDPSRVLAALDALPPAGEPDLAVRRRRLRDAVAAAG